MTAWINYRQFASYFCRYIIILCLVVLCVFASVLATNIHYVYADDIPSVEEPLNGAAAQEETPADSGDEDVGEGTVAGEAGDEVDSASPSTDEIDTTDTGETEQAATPQDEITEDSAEAPEETPTENIDAVAVDEPGDEDAQPADAPTDEPLPSEEQDISNSTPEISDVDIDIETDDADAQSALLLDPYFTRNGVTYYYMTDCSGYDNCTVTSTPIQAAINDLNTNGMPDDNTLYVKSGTFSETILIDGISSTLILKSIEEDTTTLSGNVTIRNSSGTVKLDTFAFTGTISLQNAADVILIGTEDVDDIQLSLLGSDPINVSISGGDDDDSLTVLGSSADESFVYDGSITRNGNQVVQVEEIESLTIKGGTGTDTLTGPDVEADFTINGSNSGNVNGVAFIGFENLAGGVKADNFIFTDSGSISGTIDGGLGLDTLNYATLTAGVTVNLNGTASKTGGIADIENVIGTVYADSINGSAEDNDLNGNGGSDTINGGAGDDHISVVLYGSSASAAVVNGGDDDDSLTVLGTSSDEDFSYNTLIYRNNLQSVAFSDFETVTLDGRGGTDTLTAVNAAAFVINAENAGTLDDIAFANIENLVGSSDADTFTFADEGDLDGTINGGSGNDSLTASDNETTFTLSGANSGTIDGITFTSIESLAGGENNDTFTIESAGSLSGDLTGGSGDDSLDGPSLAMDYYLTDEGCGYFTGITFYSIEYLTGSSLNDKFHFVATDEDYGTGEIYTIVGSMPGMLDGGGGSDTVYASDQFMLFTLTGTNSGTIDDLTPFQSIENLVGGAGDDEFVFEENGQLTGSINGGAGQDGLDYSQVSWDVTVDLAAGTATKILSISNISDVFGGTGNDHLYGDDLDNILHGGDGDDYLDGRGGNDTLIGDGGNDTLIGAAGNDTYTFDADNELGSDIITDTAGMDWLDLSATEMGITLDMSLADQAHATYAQIVVCINLTLAMVGVDNVLGGRGNDTIKGDEGDNILVGGPGDDIIVGGAGNDTASYSTNTYWPVQVDLGAGTAVSDDSGNDTLSEIENVEGTEFDDEIDGDDAANILYGGAGNDILRGGAGNDTLYGEDGADILTGGGGDDVLYGGAGDDTFVFDADSDLGTRHALRCFRLGHPGFQRYFYKHNC